MADKPTTEAMAAGGGGVPENLKKYVGEDGALDMAKVSQGIQEAEQRMHQATQEAADAKAAYQLAVDDMGLGTGGGADASGRSAGAGGGAGAGSEGREGSEGEEPPITRQDAAPIVRGVLELIHPEVAVDPVTMLPKNKEFFDGLTSYVRQLPLHIRQRLLAGDFGMQDWVLKQYKALRGSGEKAKSGAGASAASAAVKPNFAEGASAGEGGEPKTWTRAEIRSLIKNNPAEYQRRAEEIQVAYKEGRVK